MCLLLNVFPDHDHYISNTTIQRDYWTFLGEFYNNSGAFTECFMGHFQRGVLQLFQKILKGLFWISSRTTKVYSRTVLEQTIRSFLELFWNHSEMF